jgi:hypothetical protein
LFFGQSAGETGPRYDLVSSASTGLFPNLVYGCTAPELNRLSSEILTVFFNAQVMPLASDFIEEDCAIVESQIARDSRFRAGEQIRPSN